MYQSVQGFCPFKRAARGINKGEGARLLRYLPNLSCLPKLIFHFALGNQRGYRNTKTLSTCDLLCCGVAFQGKESQVAIKKKKKNAITQCCWERRVQSDIYLQTARCMVCFSVDTWWRALTWRFLPAPMNYSAVSMPLRQIISVLDRYNNVAQCNAMPRLYSHD